MKQKLSIKQQRAIARQKLKSARSGRNASGLDALSNNNSDNEDGASDNNQNDDVYERMTESEYKEYVERKREREDFVVDDGTSFLLLLFNLVVYSCWLCLYVIFFYKVHRLLYQFTQIILTL